MDERGRSGLVCVLASAPPPPSAPAARVRGAPGCRCERGTSRRGSSARARRYDAGGATETSERRNFAPARRSFGGETASELRTRADAELRVDVRQVAGHRPLAQEERGRHLPVRSALRNERRHAALGRRQPLLARAPRSRPSSARASPPSRRHRAARTPRPRPRSRRGRVASDGAPPDDAESQQRACPAERIPDALVPGDRLPEQPSAPSTSPRPRRRDPCSASRARAPIRARRAPHPSPRVSTRRIASSSSPSSSRSSHVSAVHQRRLGSRQPSSAACCVGPREPLAGRGRDRRPREQRGR